MHPGGSGWTTWSGTSQPVATYMAPGDPSSPQNGIGSWASLGVSSYVGNMQALGGMGWSGAPDFGYMNWYAGWAGDTNAPTASIPKSFRDGTSNTITFLEKYSECGDGSISPSYYQAARETLWSYAYYHGVSGYPNGPIYNVIGSEALPNLRDMPQFAPTDHQCDYARVQGYYSAVIQVAMGDGSSRAVGPEISLTTWYRALNPKDGQVLGPEW